jgi:hypothetical protein
MMASFLSTMENQIKVAYHFYRRNWNGEDQYVGHLVEKRRKPERITHASIMTYARLIARLDVLEERLYFLREEI